MSEAIGTLHDRSALTEASCPLHELLSVKVPSAY